MWQEDECEWDKEALKDYVCGLIDEWFENECVVGLKYDKNKLEVK